MTLVSNLPDAITPAEQAELDHINAGVPSSAEQAELDHINANPSGHTSFGDALKSLGMGLVRGVGEGVGAAGDVANLITLGAGKVGDYVDKRVPSLASLDDYYGTRPSDLIDQSRKGLTGDNGPDLSSSYIGKLLDKAGISYAPQGDAAQKMYNVAHFAGSMLTPDGGASILKAGVDGGVKAATKEVGKNLLVGTGSGIGQEGGRQLANALNTDNPYVHFGLDAAGAVLGGGATGLGASRFSPLYEKPESLQYMHDAGVSPHFPSDVNPNPGPVGRFFSSVLPDRFGAQGVSARNAQSTQDQLKNYLSNSLELENTPSPTIQGEYLKQQAQGAIDGLQAKTKAAYDDLDKVVPANTPVQLTKTSAALNDLVNRATDPDIKALVSTPAFAKYSAIAAKPSLSWSDMNILKQEIGQSMKSAEGPELGLLKQIYGGHDASGNAGGIIGDMRDAASTAHPEGLEKFNAANDMATTNNEKIKGILDDVVNKPNPETIPGWMTQQTKLGSSRLNDLFDGLPQVQNAIDPGAPPTKGDIGRWMLGNAAYTDDKGLDVDKLMGFWNSRAPEAQQSMSGPLSQPLDNGANDIRNTMERGSSMYDATAKSRELAGKPKQSAFSDPFSAISMLGGAAGTVGSLAAGDSHAGLASIIGMSEPAIMNTLARVGQSPLMSRLSGPNMGDMIPASQSVGRTAAALPSNVFPDVYKPDPNPQHADLPTGADVQKWLGSTDRGSATNFVAQRLGPDVAKQLASTDDIGYKSALFNLSSDPNFRKQLASSPLPDDSGEDAGAGDIPTMTIHPSLERGIGGTG